MTRCHFFCFLIVLFFGLSFPASLIAQPSSESPSQPVPPKQPVSLIQDEADLPVSDSFLVAPEISQPLLQDYSAYHAEYSKQEQSPKALANRSADPDAPKVSKIRKQLPDHVK